MLGCRDARKPISMVSLRISELPNLPISRLLTQSSRFATFVFPQAQRSSRTAGPLLKCNAPLAPASHHPDLIASLCISELLNFPTSHPLSLRASQPPSLQASWLPILPAYSIILYFSLIDFSTSAGMYDFSSTARIFFAISRARVRVSMEPFSIHFSRLFWSDTPLPLKYS